MLIDPERSADRPVGGAGGHRRITRNLLGPVGQVIARLVAGRGPLDCGGARQAQGLVAAQSLDRIAQAREYAGKRRAVLDRLRRALRQERQHRMAGIAKQRHAVDRPARQGRAVEQAPDENLVHGRDQRTHLLMPAGVESAQIGGIAPLGPAFLGPVVAVDQADEIDELTAAHRVADEVATGAEPELVFNMHVGAGKAVGRDHAAIGDAAGEARLFRAEQNLGARSSGCRRRRSQYRPSLFRRWQTQVRRGRRNRRAW